LSFPGSAGTLLGVDANKAIDIFMVRGRRERTPEAIAADLYALALEMV